MVWNIITDSSCDLEEFLLQEGDHTINYKSVPFIISVDSKDYIDVEGMDTDEMLVQRLVEHPALLLHPGKSCFVQKAM